MRGHGEKLSRKQEQAIAALICEPTISAAAARTGVSQATLWRWLRWPPFEDHYRRARRQLVDTAVSHLQEAAGEAVDALRRNLTCGAPTSEVQAARHILDHALRGLELLDLVARVDKIERVLNEGGS